MNKTRRKELTTISDKLDELRIDLVTLRDEEQEYIDNMPEGICNSEKGTTAENAVSYMDDAINSLDDAIRRIDISWA